MKIFHNKVYLVDRVRAFFSGAASPLVESAAMLVLIEIYQSSTAAKTMLGMLLKSGLFFSMFLTSLISRKSLRLNMILPAVLFLAALLTALSIRMHSAAAFVILLSLAGVCFLSQDTLLTDLYSGLEKKSRGKIFSLTAMSLIAGSLCFSFLFQNLLSGGSIYLRTVFDITALSLVLAAAVSLLYPALKFSDGLSFSPASLLKILRDDRVFAWICAGWFLMGTANLWVMPYRVNLLSEKQFGFEYSAAKILFLIVLLPEAVKFVMLPFFGRMFDRMPLMNMRVGLNVLFLLYALFFFAGGSLLWQIFGSICLGLAASGGEIIWKLWVTRIAPPEKSSSYMAVHTSLTGIRQTLAPAAGLIALQSLSPAGCAYISAVLIVISTLMFLKVRERTAEY